jgi:hypothetical protein
VLKKKKRSRFSRRLGLYEKGSKGEKKERGKAKNSLLVKVQGDGEVLPGRLVDGRGPDLGVLPVEHLERVLVARPADDGAGLEVELVRAIVCGLVPDVLKFLSLAR